MSKAERTRQFIIETVAPVFNKQGYAATSLSDLTQATGLTKGAIYGNFGSKEDVALAVFNHNYGLIAAGLRAEFSRAQTAIEQLLVYPHFYRTIYPLIVTGAGAPF